LAADGTTERVDAADADDIRLSDDATQLLVFGQHDTAPHVNATTLGVTNVWSQKRSEEEPWEMTRAAYRDGYWGFEEHVVSDNMTTYSPMLCHVAAGSSELACLSFEVEPADGTWGFSTAGDWVARNFYATSVACSWRLDLASDAGLTRKTATGCVESARLSGDEQFLYVGADFKTTSYLYAAELGLRPPDDRPVSITTGDRAIRRLNPRPGGRELLFARVPWDAVACDADAECGDAEYALVLDPRAARTVELPGLAGPQWTPDGLGIVAERAETLVYAPILEPDAVYELGAAHASEIYVPSGWPPAERPR